MKKVLRCFCMILGFLATANGLILGLFTHFKLGHLLTLSLGIFLILLPILWKKLPKFIKIAAISGLFLLLGILCFFFTYGKTDTVTYREDVLIVLGAGIKGEEVTVDLQRRLDSAFCYYEKNKDVLIVVSGGQGPDEGISEALAMKKYLTAKGIPEEQILMEDRSTSTKENFLFTKQLLSEYFQGEYTAAFVTSDFHILRAGILADHEGFEDIHHLHSNTPFYTVLPNGLRECLGILKMWILDT